MRTVSNVQRDVSTNTSGITPRQCKRHGDVGFTRNWDVIASFKSCTHAHCALPVKFSRKGTPEVLSRYTIRWMLEIQVGRQLISN